MSGHTITGTPVCIPSIRAECTQMGLSVEASRDGGKTWQFVQLSRYKVRETPTVQAYKSAINPAQDLADYFAELDARGIRYKRERAA